MFKILSHHESSYAAKKIVSTFCAGKFLDTDIVRHKNKVEIMLMIGVFLFTLKLQYRQNMRKKF